MSGVEEVLAAHGSIGYDDVDGCDCGADVRTHAAHRAHVAEQLQPLIRQAQAEAWREGVATALNFAVRNEDGITLSMDLLVAHPNPYRAGDA